MFYIYIYTFFIKVVTEFTDHPDKIPYHGNLNDIKSEINSSLMNTSKFFIPKNQTNTLINSSKILNTFQNQNLNKNYETKTNDPLAVSMVASLSNLTSFITPFNQTKQGFYLFLLNINFLINKKKFRSK